MDEAFKRLVNYFSTGDNYDKLLWVIIGLLVTAIFNFMKSQLNKFIKISWRYLKKLVRLLTRQIKHLSKRTGEQIKYRLTIRKIVKGKKEIPPYFLLGKTRENNPGLTKIFNLIDDGILEEPKELKLARYLKENPIDLDKLPPPKIGENIYIKTPDFIRNIKNDNKK